MTIAGTLAFHRTALGDMGALQRRIDTAQQAIASGTRLSRASDDPVASTSVARLNRVSGDAAAYAINRQVARDSLTTADTALQSIAALFARVRELLVQGRNGTLGVEDRVALGVETLGLHDQLVSLANARDGRGRAVFGGGGEAAYVAGADGAVRYVGDDTASPVMVEEGVTIAAIDSGEAVFGRAFDAVRALGLALRSGDTAGLADAGDAMLVGEARIGEASRGRAAGARGSTCSTPPSTPRGSGAPRPARRSRTRMSRRRSRRCSSCSPRCRRRRPPIRASASCRSSTICAERDTSCSQPSASSFCSSWCSAGSPSPAARSARCWRRCRTRC